MLFVIFNVSPSDVKTSSVAPSETTRFDVSSDTLPVFAVMSFQPFAVIVEPETVMFPSFADPFTSPEVPFIVIAEFTTLTWAENSETLPLYAA